MIAVALALPVTSAWAQSFDSPRDDHPPDASQQLDRDEPVQRRDTPNDPDYDRAEPDDESPPPGPPSTSLFDERVDLFGFASALTRTSARYLDPTGDNFGNARGSPPGNRAQSGRPCIPRRLRVTRTRVGPAHIGRRVRRLTRRYRVAGRGRLAVRLCVRGGGRLLVRSRGGKVNCIASTARGHRTRQAGPGSRARGGRIRGARRLRRQMLIAPRQRCGRHVVYGLNRRRVTYVVVVPRRQTARPLRLARQLRALGPRR